MKRIRKLNEHDKKDSDTHTHIPPGRGDLTNLDVHMDKALSREGEAGGVMIYHQRAPVCLCAPARTNELSKCVEFAFCNLWCVMSHGVYKRAMVQLLVVDFS